MTCDWCKGPVPPSDPLYAAVNTLRQAAIRHRIAYTTTLSAASAASDAILSLRSRRPSVRSLQEWQQDILDAAAVEV